MKDQKIKLPPLPETDWYAVWHGQALYGIYATLTEAADAAAKLNCKGSVSALFTEQHLQEAQRAAIEAAKPHIIADFLERTGQWVTNKATHDKAISDAIEADRQTTAKQFAAYKRLTESLESRIALLQKQYDELKKTTDPSLLESERAANVLLTEEVEVLKADREAKDTLYANQYLSLTDAMGYESDSGLSPEEWASALRSDRQTRGEPVLYQSRTRPTWAGARKRWSVWKSCTKDQADDYRRVKVLHGWEYEVRELYPAPQPQQIPEDFLRSVINLCAHHGASPFDVQCFDPDDKWVADLWREAEAMLEAAPEPTEPSNTPSAPAVVWLYEDELPPNYPYDAMFPYSKVDGVRMFPVFVPQPLPAPVGQVRWRNGEPIVWWKTNQIPEVGALLYTTIPPVTE